MFCFSIGRAAEAFRVDSETRFENSPPLQSTTFLIGGAFYDFIGDNGEIIFFDPQRDTFTLIDQELRIQTRVAASETRQRISLQQKALEGDKNGYIAFMAKPTFTMEFDEAAGLMSLQSPWIDYTLSTKPFPDAETAKIYFDFCNWLCYLNTRTNSNPSLMARLEVNRILREKNRFPESIKVSIFRNGKKLILSKEEKLESKHEISRRLADVDRQRIEKATESMRTFKEIPFLEYQKMVAEKHIPKK